ncbi:MAG: DUF1330 domain-containing protein [Pseudomonadota bacterium]
MLWKNSRSLILAATMAASLAAPAFAEDATPAYLVAQLNITDLQTYMQDYGMPVFPQLIAAGGEVLVATPEAQVLEGSTDATWSVVVRFPDMNALNGWYSSEEYQAVAPRRRELTDGNQSFLIAAPQFEGLPG